MAMSAAGIRTASGDFGAAAQSLFAGFAADKLAGGYEASAGGYGEAAAGYRTAAGYARINVGYAETDKDIKLQKADRTIFQTIGGAKADIAGAGFTQGGSALDILRDSIEQGELTRELVTLQGDININAAKQQVEAYETQARVADQQQQQALAQAAAAKGNKVAGILNGIAGVASLAAMFSDRRLKFDLRYIGVWQGLKLYSFRYLFSPWRTHLGCIAQEVQEVRPTAVTKHWTGFLMVDYSKAFG